MTDTEAESPALGAWSPIEDRNGVAVSATVVPGQDHQALVVWLHGNAVKIPTLFAEYTNDLARRMADGWSLVTMTMYPIGHHAGAGYPGMDLDKAMVVVTYRRADLAASKPQDM